VSHLRACIRLLLIIISVVVILPIYTLIVMIARLFGLRSLYATVMVIKPIANSIWTRLFGVRRRIIGRRSSTAQIFVANHLSYLDIIVAGGAIGGVFVSRHDVKEWPVVGWFARLEGTVFLDRTSIRSAVESSSGILERARLGARIILFPEGGITKGREVAPFKPFLIAGITGAGLTVQPVTIDYTHIGRNPVTPEQGSLIYWDDPDTPLHKHLWRLLGFPWLRVTITFHEPIVSPTTSDKVAVREFTERLRDLVAGGLQ
jgi:1-acyl-sn-glycerol-3-phosphate acyltransferase